MSPELRRDLVEAPSARRRADRVAPSLSFGRSALLGAPRALRMAASARLTLDARFVPCARVIVSGRATRA